MSKKLSLAEVLTEAGNQKSKQDKIDYLRKNGSVQLQTVLKGAYDDAVVWDLPEGKPPYRKDDAPRGFEYTNLYRVARKFAWFVKGGKGKHLPAVRREKMFIDILESLHSDEAELVLNMKEKSLMGKYNGITSALVAEAFPNLLVKPMANPRAKAARVRRAAAKANANKN